MRMIGGEISQPELRQDMSGAFSKPIGDRKKEAKKKTAGLLLIVRT